MNTIGPSLVPQNEPHIICDKFPYLVRPLTFFKAYFSCLFWCRKIHIWWLSLSFWIADSSDHITFFHFSSLQRCCSNAQLRRFSACTAVNAGLSTALHLCIWSSCSRRWSSVLICSQRCSIGFIFEEFDGHSININSCFSIASSNHLWVLCDVWGRALSCWKTIFVISSPLRASM